MKWVNRSEWDSFVFWAVKIFVGKCEKWWKRKSQCCQWTIWSISRRRTESGINSQVTLTTRQYSVCETLTLCAFFLFVSDYSKLLHPKETTRSNYTALVRFAASFVIFSSKNIQTVTTDGRTGGMLWEDGDNFLEREIFSRLASIPPFSVAMEGYEYVTLLLFNGGSSGGGGVVYRGLISLF